MFAESYDKKHVLEELIKIHPKKKRWLIKGDSEEDTEMLNALKALKNNGKIDYVVGINVTKNEINALYDINVMRDYRGLVELIQKQRQRK